MLRPTFPPLTPPNGKLRVGLIGAGDISFYHLSAWRKLATVELAAICDLDSERARRRAAEFDIPTIYNDVATMLRGAQLDALDIATWRETHGSIVRLAAAHGVHVLCQKPLTPTLDEAVALLGDVGNRIRLMVHENRRFAPHFRMIRSWIDAERLGDVRQCIATMHRSGFLRDAAGKRPAVERAPYMATEKRLLIAETLIHQLDVLRFLLGPLGVIAARKLHTESDMPGETLATIMLETPRGAPVILAGSFVAPGFGATVSDRLEIIGSEASIILDGDRLAIRGPQPEEHRFDSKLSYQACFDEAIAHFVGGLIAGTAFETEGEDNLRTLRLVEDSYRLAGPIGQIDGP